MFDAAVKHYQSETWPMPERLLAAHCVENHMSDGWLSALRRTIIFDTSPVPINTPKHCTAKTAALHDGELSVVMAPMYLAGCGRAPRSGSRTPALYRRPPMKRQR